MADEVEVDVGADDGLGGTIPTAEPESPWDAVDDDLKKYAEGKGFKDVGDILKSQRDAEAELRRMQSEYDQIRREAEPMWSSQDVFTGLITPVKPSCPKRPRPMSRFS